MRHGRGETESSCAKWFRDWHRNIWLSGPVIVVVMVDDASSSVYRLRGWCTSACMVGWSTSDLESTEHQRQVVLLANPRSGRNIQGHPHPCNEMSCVMALTCVVVCVEDCADLYNLCGWWISPAGIKL